jgi:Na+-translocating ferredoxin:NAD+ oxidoreductase RnfG subunit
MKKIMVFFLVLALLASPAAAFLYEITVLTKEEIQKLSDSDLEDAYIEARIEEKTSREFHTGAGYNSAKDYNKRKQLLRYIFELRREIGNREELKDLNLDEYFR